MAVAVPANASASSVGHVVSHSGWIDVRFPPAGCARFPRPVRRGDGGAGGDVRSALLVA